MQQLQLDALFDRDLTPTLVLDVLGKPNGSRVARARLGCQGV